jgi:hypothetical protein
MLKHLTLALALVASPAFARIVHAPPPALETAPIDRVIVNVEADQTLSEATREQLLGRLHLIGYAQVDANLGRFANNQWHVCPGPADQRDLQRCGDSFTPPRELPRIVMLPMTDLARSHLRRAQQHYARALELDAGNLRARLGYAYILDELGRTNDARRQLRRILERSDAAFRRGDNGESVSWDDRAVLREAIDHLGALARSREDRTAVANLRQRLGGVDEIVVAVTPIVVPLSDAPFEMLADNASPVAFDFAGTGDVRAQGWLSANAAWLVWDPKGRGDVRSGFDLLGQRTWAVFWTDGFEAMRSLDDNRDGELAGAELGGLALWRDQNSNGRSDAGEVAPVAEFGVVALAVRGAEERPGLLTARNGVRFSNGAQLPLYDWTPGYGREPTS